MGNLTLLCIREMDNFKEGIRYRVIANHKFLVTLIGEDGYKMNFVKRENDINLLYLWDYFYDIDKYKLEKNIEKIY